MPAAPTPTAKTRSEARFELRLLGGATLLDAEGRPVKSRAVHRHRLALMALLARSHPAGVSRERLVGLLWPERDSASARHLLRQAIHEIRGELGTSTIGGVGDDVWMDTGRVAVDVVAFEAAIAAGALEEAVALYRGPFLDGFFLDDAQEFDEWTAMQRAQLAGRHEAALESLAVAASKRDDQAAAARWWRVLARARPSDSRVALQLVESLDALRDRAGALAAADEHIAYLRDEIGVGADAAFLARVERIRSAPRQTPPDVVSAVVVDADAADASATLERAPARESVTTSSQSTASSFGRRATDSVTYVPADGSRSRIGRFVAAFVVVLLVVAAIAYWRRPASTASRSLDVVAVLPFSYHGGGDLAYLGPGLPRLLTANLNGAGQLRTIDPVAIARATGDDVPTEAAAAERVALDVANRFGAGLVVTGDVVQSGDRLRITAKVLRVSDAATRTSAVEIVADGTRDKIFELVDDFSARLVAAWGTERGARLTDLAARTTTSLPALRAYLEGEREYSAARYSTAVAAFQRAVAADTGFALAYYRLSSALTWTSDPRTLPVTAQARRFIGRLSQRDSLLVEARFANSSGEPVRAEQLYQRLLADYPDELEGWLQIAEVGFHWSAALGRPLRNAGVPFARALALDSSSLPPYVHLARIAAADRDTALLTRLVARVAVQAKGTSEAADAEALRAFVVGSPAEIASASAALIASHGGNVLRALQGIAAVTGNLDASLAIAQQLAARDRGTDAGASAEIVVAQIEAARGRWSAASAALDRAAERVPDAAAMYRAAFAAAPFQRLTVAQLRDARAAVLRARGLPFSFPLGNSADSTRDQWLLGPRRAYLVARLALRAGDSAEAAAALRASPGASAFERSTLARVTALAYAEHAALTGDSPKGLALLGDAPTQLDSLLPRFASYIIADERYVRGMLFSATRADTIAMRWMETFPDASGYDLIYLAPAHLARAQLYERRGDKAKAVAEYQRFIALWKDCDVALLPLVDEARRRVGGR